MSDLSSLSDEQLAQIAGVSLGSDQSLSVRNNNPGNMRGGSGFASFDTPKAGLAAMQHDLELKIAGNSPVMKAKFGDSYQPTLRNVISTWAPPSENNTENYVNFVSKHAGLDPDQPLTVADAQKIMQPMISMEGGKKASDYFGKIMSGIGDAIIPPAEAATAPSGLSGVSDDELANIAGVQLESQPAASSVPMPGLVPQSLPQETAKAYGANPMDSQATAVAQARMAGDASDPYPQYTPASQPFIDTFQSGAKAGQDFLQQALFQPTKPAPTPDLDALRQYGWKGASGPQRVGAVEEALMGTPPGQLAQFIGGTALNIPTTLIGLGNKFAEEKLGVPHQYSQAAEMALPLFGKTIEAAPNLKAIGAKINALETASQNLPGIIGNTEGLVPPIPTSQIKPLPKEMSGLEALPDAAKGTLLAKKANPLEVGLQANQKISQAYETARSYTNKAYDTARAEGNFSIQAPELYNKLDSTVKYLSDKVAPGSREHIALIKLGDIRDGLQEKYGSATPPTYGITPSDLIDIKAAINDGISSKKFVDAGGSRLLDFKSYVNDALGKASQAKPSFGKSLKKAEDNQRILSRRFLNNSELKPFWQPEDHMAWKASKNNREAPAYTDATLSRAEKFLDNLNSKSAGRVSAIGNALSKQDAQTLFKQAIVKAKGGKASIGKAAFTLATGHPVKAAGTLFNAATKSQEIPLQELAKQVSKLRKK